MEWETIQRLLMVAHVFSLAWIYVSLYHQAAFTKPTSLPEAWWYLNWDRVLVLVALITFIAMILIATFIGDAA